MKKKWATAPTGKEVTSYKIHTLIVSFENKCTVPIRGGRGEEANFEVSFLYLISKL